MAYQEFLVPQEGEWLNVFGIESEPVSKELTIRSVSFTVGTESLVITYDIFGRSFYCAWKQNDAKILEVFREGATCLTIEEKEDQKLVCIDFKSNELAGKIIITV